jgi:hypothetical protein
MRKSLTGRTMSQEARDAMARAQTGRKHPPTTLEKMKASAVQRHVDKPLVRSKDELNRLRNLAVGLTRTPEHKAAISTYLKGRPKSPEHRARLAAAQSAYQQRKKEQKMTLKCTMPAGAYYLGDPCYTLSGRAWDAHCNAPNAGDQEGVVRIGDFDIVTFSTALGDGVFKFELGEVWVDSTHIGLVPVSAATEESKHVHRVVFDEPVVCEKRGKNLVFGPYVIDTNPANYKYEPD